MLSTIQLRKKRQRQADAVRKARVWLRRRKAVEAFIDGAFVFFLFGYELPHNSRWILFAELFWSDCPICFWYRGAVFGAFLGIALSIITMLVM